MKHQVIPCIALGLLTLCPQISEADALFVLTTDYETGSSSRLDLDAPWSVDFDVEPVGPDPLARYFGGKIYVVNRFGADNIQVIDPATSATLHQHSTGAGSNPQDIVVLSETRAYVSRYDADTLIEFDPTTGATLAEISLVSLADADGSPEASRLFFQDPYLYVQIQRLDRNNFYVPTDFSSLAVIDVRNNTLVDVDPNSLGMQGILLESTNPFGPMSLDTTDPRRLLVGCPGDFGDPTDGGLEAVSLETWMTEGTLISGATLGGELLEYEPGLDGKGFAIVSNASFVTCLRLLDPSAGVVLSTPYCSSGYDLAALLASAEGHLYVSDRDFIDPGVRVFDLSDGSPLSSGVISVGLPPVGMVLLRPTTSSAPETDSAPESSLSVVGNVQPNPSSGSVQWALSAEAMDRPVAIVDALGRTVRRLASGTLSWDGSDTQGRVMPSGVYWIRVEGSGQTEPAVRSFRRLR